MIARLALALFSLAAVGADAGTCKGKDPCTACRDCSKCEFCTSGKGSCGVCRAQTSPQRDAAKKKRPAK